VDEAKAFGPATIANLGAGFDVLGLAVDGLGDTVSARRTASLGVRISDIESVVPLPYDPVQNVAGIAALAVLASAEATFGVELSISKGMGVGTGLGSSAASGAAAAVAVNALLEVSLSADVLISAVIEGETAVSGCHGDNAAAAILGGLVLVESVRPLRTRALPVPGGGLLVLVTPKVEVSTRTARSILPSQIPRADAILQGTRLSAMVDACYRDDLQAFCANAVDVIAEPTRLHLIPGGEAALKAALESGAMQSFLCGSGPTLGAIVNTQECGFLVADAMTDAVSKAGVSSTIHFSRLDNLGARLL
jgi:homoserine kinase